MHTHAAPCISLLFHVSPSPLTRVGALQMAEAKKAEADAEFPVLGIQLTYLKQLAAKVERWIGTCDKTGMWLKEPFREDFVKEAKQAKQEGYRLQCTTVQVRSRRACVPSPGAMGFRASSPCISVSMRVHVDDFTVNMNRSARASSSRAPRVSRGAKRGRRRVPSTLARPRTSPRTRGSTTSTSSLGR